MNDPMRFQGPENVPGVAKEENIPFDSINGEDLLKELEAIVERLKVVYGEQKKTLNDDIIEVPRFCRCLEAILRHQQKEKLTFWSEKKDYFHYLTEGTIGLKSLENLVKNVQGMTELVTGQGKGRALIRMCLVQQLLADCLQSSISNSKKTKDWYNPAAVFLNPSLSDRLVSSLYDLSSMEFDLPVKGINLEETWPSFVQKSFSNNANSIASPGQRKGRLHGFKGQTVQREPIARMRMHYELERAVEEKPSEVFVRQEIPFDINVVSRLFSELRSVLTDEFEGYTQDSVLPEITVDKLDDITSGLSLLKDYITTMSQDVTDSSRKSHEVIKELRSQLADANNQLKESQRQMDKMRMEAETSEMHIKSTLKMVDNIKEEKAVLRRQVVQQEEEISLLKASSQLLKSSDEQKRDEKLLEECQMKLESMQNELRECRQALSEERTAKETLSKEYREKKDSCARLEEEALNLMTEKKEAERQFLLEKDKQVNELKKIISEKSDVSTELSRKLNTAEERHQKEFSALREEMSRLSKRCQDSEEERDTVREELMAMQGLVEQETASLRFQLSTSNMQLQQTNEAVLNKDQELSELKQRFHQQSEEMSQVVTESKQKQDQISELMQQLSISETKCNSLQEDLLSLNGQLAENTLNRDAVREESLRMQREWDDQKDRMTTDTQKLNQQVSNLTEENESLRKALQKLLEQKVNLWQHADELEQEQVSKGVWIDSRMVAACMGCKAAFTIFNRKHHCRSCGKVFCTQCCSHKVQLPSSRDPTRVCKVCFERINSLRTPHAASLVNTLERDTDQAHRNLTSSSEPINTFPGGVALSENSLHLTPLDGSDESLLQHVKELVRTPHNSSKHVSQDNSVEYSVDPLLSPAPVMRTDTFGLTSSDNDTVDTEDEFCIIDIGTNQNETLVQIGAEDSKLDVSTLRAKLATLETSNTNEFMNSSNELESARSPVDDDIQEVEDMEVVGGGSHQVIVKVDTPRSIVMWQFSSQPRGIAMGLGYQESVKDEIIQILPERRVMSHKTILNGEYVTQKAGIYTLIFNNSHSKYSGRQLSYKVWKKPPV